MASNIKLNAVVTSVIMLLATLFVAVNLGVKGFSVGMIYSIMGVFAAITYLYLNATNKYALGVEIGDGTDWKKDVVTGVLVGICWAAMAMLFSKSVLSIAFSMGVPMQLAVPGDVNLIALLVFAPFIETMFKGALFSLLRLKVPQTISLLITALVFSAFHWFAYTKGDYYAVKQPFIAAGLFGLLALSLAIKRNNMLTCVPFHAIVNGFVAFVQKSGMAVM